MKHSKEPWEMFEGVSSTIIDEHGFLVGITHGYGVPIEDAISNAERIIACVNACKGIRTDALDVGIVGKVLKTIDDIDMVCCLKVWEEVR